METKDIKVGSELWDVSVGLKVTVRALPRRISGGCAVDVVSDLPHVKGYAWTACVCNLRPIEA